MMSNTQVTLTTIDNPFNPFEDFVNWFLFDIEKGYNTCSYLGRIAKITDDMTQKEEDAEVERACDEILLYDFRNIYIKVRKSDNTKNTKTA